MPHVVWDDVCKSICIVILFEAFQLYSTAHEVQYTDKCTTPLKYLCTVLKKLLFQDIPTMQIIRYSDHARTQIY